MAELRLAPFPDELLAARDKRRAVAFLNSMPIRYEDKAPLLRRWGAATAVELEAADFRALRETGAAGTGA